jgi:hypothetical protein
VTYIDELAANLQRRIPRELLPDADTDLLMQLYALLALVKGEDVSNADVHDAWSLWTQSRAPGHRSLRPFAELDAETQASDTPFTEAIRAVAAELPESLRIRGASNGKPQ